MRFHPSAGGGLLVAVTGSLSSVRSRASMAVVLTASVLVLGAGSARAAPGSSCVPVWTIAQLPHGGSATSLYGSAAASSADVWAVGSFYNGRTDLPRVEHWNGTTWSVVGTPKIRSAGYLEEAVALSASDVWAVGYTLGRTGAPQTLTEHWNGTSWSVVRSPNVVGAIANYLVDVSAVSASDVWGVGYEINGTGVYRTLVEHWNGRSWSLVTSPNVGAGDNLLQGVAAVSSGDIWAAGFSKGPTGSTQTLAERWNGTSWSVVTSPNPGSTSDSLNRVAASSSTDVWAVGSFYDGTNNVTLIERWTGSAWSVVASPNVVASGNVLLAVGSGTASDIWAVGYYYPTRGTRVFETLTEHWNGSAWTLVRSPNQGTGDNYLRSVAMLGTGAAWAVGSTTKGGLVESTCT